MNTFKITGNSVALDADGYANNVTASSGVAFTLITDETTDGLAHKIIITPSGSVTGNYAITGNDANGSPISETLATNTTNAVTSVNHYLDTIVVKAPSGLGAETVDIGWAAASVSPWEFLNEVWGPLGMGFACVKDSGSPTYTAQQQYGDGTAFDHATVSGETTSQEGTYTTPVRAVRLSWAAAGEVSMYGLY